MLSAEEATGILERAELICSEEAVSRAVADMAAAITAELSHSHPLVLSVMGGAVVFTGQLLPRLAFPLDFDYVHVSRYDNEIRGGDISWRTIPRESVRGRVVLVLDDILDEGITLAVIRDWVLGHGAAAFYSAVFAEKCLGRAKPVEANFVGIVVPNCYVFGFGMDIHGAWRNLPAVYALREPPRTPD
ncbi:hypoxanthine-guanine phosphoribosyltransferase [Nitrosovibrio sp. Nv17]|uniref:hypoxanthine-guanine phosphoribosyltransferase n=1 Tax=Nitrosovibrio sp. Nv17 TaxID=1855339 RepID=UPI000908A684|nr:hypoxanthine-guanine phosphoribosyltransferase [Nitrosovibrio sp. Nv17]SFW18039.1 hypoxanthine phosphoribosyltransferase [Nitrosovibrio sp. Nv17]